MPLIYAVLLFRYSVIVLFSFAAVIHFVVLSHETSAPNDSKMALIGTIVRPLILVAGTSILNGVLSMRTSIADAEIGVRAVAAAIIKANTLFMFYILLCLIVFIYCDILAYKIAE